MIALMTLWFGPAAGFHPEPGYFYLCPACYQACIAPLATVIVHRLTEHHPIARRAHGWTMPGTAVEPPAGNDEPSPPR
jgi:hypothetical protein